MNIEIIEIYPFEYNKDKEIFTGTLRIRLLDFGLHILGVYFSKRKDFYFFSLPGRNGTHHETGKAVSYPFIVLEDQERHHELLDTIREKGRIYIEKRLADTENPLIFSGRLKKEEKKPLPSKNSATESKATTTQQVSNKKVWQDPPKRFQNTPHSNVY